MDFEYRPNYTPELEDFRKEVRTWMEGNIPPEIKAPVDSEDMPDDLYEFGVQLRIKLAEKKNWLYPSYSKQYGGGGLTPQHGAIIWEELRRRNPPTIFSNDLILPSILVWGTEEQKQKFLPGIFSGKIICFQNFTEPQGGSDLANIKCRAVRDGDDWIINGEKTFVSGGGSGRADLLFGPMMTDPEAPRHHNLGYFLVPAKTLGVTLIPLNLLNGRNQHTVIMDNVRVPHDHLIGDDHQGWQVTQTVLEAEHGGRGQSAPFNESANDFYHFVRSTQTNGNVLGKDPLVQERVVDFYIESHLNALLGMRNYSMYNNKQEMSYEGSQTVVLRKETSVRNADRVRDVMGPYALLKHGDPRAPFQGKPEIQQRNSLVALHPGGTLEVQKVIIARRLGLSRTQERAAPTPATAAGITA